MHPVANEVDIPTEQVEKLLMQFARPGFTGQREILFRVKEEAGLAVEFIPEVNEVQSASGQRSNSSPPNLFSERAHVPTERELTVRQVIAQNRYRFRIGTKLVRLLAHFVDGQLMKTEWRIAA